MTRGSFIRARRRAATIETGPKPWLWNSMLAAKIVSNIPPGIYRAEAFIAEGNQRAKWRDRPKSQCNWPLPQGVEGGYVVVISDRGQSLVQWRKQMLHGKTIRIATHILWCEREQDAILTYLHFG